MRNSLHLSNIVKALTLAKMGILYLVVLSIVYHFNLL
mgnify:CR=1 FL=1